MNVVIHFHLIILTLFILSVEGGKETEVSDNEPDEYLNQVQELILNFVREGIDSKEAVGRHINLIKALSYCLVNGDIKKAQLASCINSVTSHFNLEPPIPLVTCIGDYVLCTARLCLGAVTKDELNYEDAEVR